MKKKIHFIFIQIFIRRENEILIHRIKNKSIDMNFYQISSIFRRRIVHNDHESFRTEKRTSDKYDEQTINTIQ